MTLIQVLKRIEQIALNHKMVRNYQKGLVQDFLTESKTKYPSVFLQDNNGSLSLKGGRTSLNYSLYVVDLVHVLSDEKTNEDDVHSDTLSIAQDLLIQMNSGNYDDWRLSSDNSFRLVVEDDNDLFAGVVIDITIDVPLVQNICEVPSTLIITPTQNDKDVKVYDLTYTATSDEGTQLVLPEVLGKKIIFISRESSVLYHVSNNPDSVEYTFDGTTIVLGNGTNKDERFLILYRNY